MFKSVFLWPGSRVQGWVVTEHTLWLALSVGRRNQCDMCLLSCVFMTSCLHLVLHWNQFCLHVNTDLKETAGDTYYNYGILKMKIRIFSQFLHREEQRKWHNLPRNVSLIGHSMARNNLIQKWYWIPTIGVLSFIILREMK